MDSLQRWHFDIRQKKCVRFVYNGKMGNQNNFRSLADCQSACPGEESPLIYLNLNLHRSVILNLNMCNSLIFVIAEFVNPCPVGGVAYQPDGETSAPIYCRDSVDQCPAHSWCHIGGSAETTVCCIGSKIV